MVVETAAGSAYRLLRDAMLDGTYAPKQRLVEADLVADLGVTRPAVREALARLEHDGLVERRPNQGATVRMFSADEIAEVLEARSVLEGLAARRAAHHATPEQVAALQRNVDEMTVLLDAEDFVGYSDAQGEFHRLLVETGRSRTVALLVDTLSAQSAQTRLRTMLVPGRLQQSLAEHRAIVEAIATRCPDVAEKEMREHLAQVTDASRSAGHHR